MTTPLENFDAPNSFEPGEKPLNGTPLIGRPGSAAPFSESPVRVGGRDQQGPGEAEDDIELEDEEDADADESEEEPAEKGIHENTTVRNLH